MDDELDIRLRRLAEKQHQVITRDQARKVGATREQLAMRLASPDWEAVTERVLRLVGVAPSFRQRCMAAVLDAGGDSAICGETALALWRVPGFGRNGPIRVSRSRGGTRRPTTLATVHEVKLLPPHHIVLLDSIRVVTPTRALFDIAARLDINRVNRALNNGWAMRLTTGRRVHRMGKEWLRRGRTGSAAMRKLLEVRPIDYVPPASNLESRFESILERAGEEVPRRQVDLGDDAHWIGRTDFKHLTLPLIAEVDSDRYHVAPLDAAKDERRDMEFDAAGILTVRFSEHEVWHQPELVVRRWRDALTNLRADRGFRARDPHAGSA